MERQPSTDGAAPERDLYTIDEARAHLGGISRNTIYDLLRNGELASVPIGRRRFISASALQAFIATSTTTLSPALATARFKRPAQLALELTKARVPRTP